MQPVSSRIWTCVAMSISYDNNHYTTGTSYLYNHPSKMNKTTGHCWRSKDKLISDVHLWTHSQCWLICKTLPLIALHGHRIEDLPGAIDDRDRWRERGKCMLALWFDDNDTYHSQYYVLPCAKCGWLKKKSYILALTFWQMQLKEKKMAFIAFGHFDAKSQIFRLILFFFLTEI